MITVTIGLTRTNRTGDDDDYVPSFDGYRAGAAQDELNVDLPEEILDGLSVEQIAEAWFAITNAPSREVVEPYRGAVQMLDYLLGQTNGKPYPGLRALSIGDTITAHGRTLACRAIGWTDVTDGGDAPGYGGE